jgi:hypothetical protein
MTKTISEEMVDIILGRTPRTTIIGGWHRQKLIHGATGVGRGE